MLAASTERVEALHDCRGRFVDSRLGGVREDPHESGFGKRTGCPPAFAVGGEPFVRGLVMDVIGIEQCYEHVNV